MVSSNSNVRNNSSKKTIKEMTPTLRCRFLWLGLPLIALYYGKKKINTRIIKKPNNGSDLICAVQNSWHNLKT